MSRAYGNYDRSVLKVFDVLGSYLVDVCYNGHYCSARERVKNGLANNITDEYRELILAYMSGLKMRQDCYKRLVGSWHEYYRKNAAGFSAMVLSDFQNKVLTQFIPPEYYADFTERQKDSVFRAIIIRSVTEFGEAILTKDILMKIIDDHQNVDNVVMLQRRMEDIFVTQRENYYAKLARKATSGVDTTIDKKAVTQLKTDFDKIKAAFLEEKRTAVQLKVDLERATAIIGVLQADHKRVTAELASVRANKSPMSDYAPRSHVESQDIRPNAPRPKPHVESQDIRPHAPAKLDIRPHAPDIHPNVQAPRRASTPYPRDVASSSSEDEPSEGERHRRHQELIANRGSGEQPNTDISSLLNDDPWG